MVFYFTVTDNSLYEAKQLDESCVGIAQAVHEGVKKALNKNYII